jgi:hypothetical protein
MNMYFHVVSCRKVGICGFGPHRDEAVAERSVICKRKGLVKFCIVSSANTKIKKLNVLDY